MPRSRFVITAQILLVICSDLSMSVRAFSQQASSAQASSRFEDYFNGPGNPQNKGDSKREAAYSNLAEMIGTMKPKEIVAGLPVIDHYLDNTAEYQDALTKPKAAGLLMYISWRPDGADLLAPEMDRLASMLNDPSHALSGIAAFTLQHIGYSRPQAVWPILEAALKAPDVNNETGIGPGIAIMLLQMGPHGDDVTEHVAQYMRRPDLTDIQLLGMLHSINSGPAITDILAKELVRSLDRPNEQIKVRALVGISRSEPSAKEAARMRLQRMANDPSETTHVKRIAARALQERLSKIQISTSRLRNATLRAAVLNGESVSRKRSVAAWRSTPNSSPRLPPR